MGKLHYGMIVSLDGHTQSLNGIGFDGSDEEVHRFVERTFDEVGTYLYGRRMYETMLHWQTAHLAPRPPQYIVDYARAWQARNKVVYSSTLEGVMSPRTRLERTFEGDALRRLKAHIDHDLSIDGPALAAQAINADLVDDYHLFITPTVTGSGTRFFPDGVRLHLDLVAQHRFDSGVIYTHYQSRA